jgi:aspartate/methionine/tyrosine aminotransferase
VAYTRDEVKSIADAVERNNLIVFADEVYLYNTFDEKAMVSIAEFVPDRVIRASSLSKEFACGGYRIGYATFPAALTPLK